MKIYGFKARVRSIEYKKYEAKKETSPDNYVAMCNLAELKQGSGKNETRHNATLYLTQDEFENQVVEVGDIIEFSDKISFLTTLVSFNIYNEDKLKEMPSNKIRTDDKGRHYAPNKAYAYHIVAKQGKWKIERKFTQIYYWQVGRLKIYMEEGEAEFRDEPSYAFYLSDKEYEKLKDCQGNYIINGYKYNSAVAKQPVNIKIERIENINKWKCTITKLEG